MVRITEFLRHESGERYLGMDRWEWEGTMRRGIGEKGGIKQNEVSKNCQNEACCIALFKNQLKNKNV